MADPTRMELFISIRQGMLESRKQGLAKDLERASQVLLRAKESVLAGEKLSEHFISNLLVGIVDLQRYAAELEALEVLRAVKDE